MGIEKYFQKKAEPKTPKKTKVDNDSDDFQQSVTSKHFAKKSEEKQVDPKSFFASSTKANPSKPVDKRKKAVINISDNEDTESAIEKPNPTKKAKLETEPVKTTVAKKPTVAKKETSKEKTIEPAKKKEPVKRTKKEDNDYIDDDSKDFEDDNFEDKDFEQDKKVPKKKETVKKTRKAEDEEFKEEAPKKTAKRAKKEDEEIKEEKPKKKGYFSMLNREAPKALGSRPEPVGADNCLDGKTFVISGEFETLTKDQTKDIVMRYGGRVTSAVSGKTTYLLRGRDAGESKLEKANKFGTKILDEDGFYNVVESSSAKENKKPTFSEPLASKATSTTATKADKGKKPESSKAKSIEDNTSLWTEKYKPKTIQEIVGNKETIKRIDEWLSNWSHVSFNSSKQNEADINTFRAVIISGPPGIGKTTAAHVVARANGYEPLEFNASDVRSKKMLEQALSEMIDNRTMTEFFVGSKKSETGAKPKGKKVVLIMDEVDGMSSGDRGGAVELASQIRKSKIPVICICNDIRSTKVAPLLRVCFDARFRRTPASQIRSRIMTIAYKEKLDIKPNAIDELVSSTQNDIRQIINILSTYRLNKASMAYDDAKQVGKQNNKNTILNLFEIPGELFSPSSWREKDLNQLSEIYFHDYSLAPLMIYENYLKSKPQKAGQMSPSGNPKEIACNEMDLVAKAAEAIADGDLVDSMIHGSTQQYSLMPVHSIFSCVRPAHYMEGHFQTRTGFPSWLGQNSKTGKNGRLLGDLHSRMRVKTYGDKSEIRQNYISTLNERIFGNIASENFEEAIEYMDNYYLDRESLETLNDVMCGSNKGPMANVPTKTKTAFTRKYNGTKHPVLFQASGEPIKRAAFAQTTEDMVDTLIEEEPEPEEAEVADDTEDNVSDSKYIHESKKRKTAPQGSSQTKKKTKKS